MNHFLPRVPHLPTAVLATLLAALPAVPLAAAPPDVTADGTADVTAVVTVDASAQAAASAAASAAGVPAAAPAQQPPIESRTASLPARGLFAGNELTATAKERLTELIVEALGLQVEVALVVPTGPWQLDGSGPDERHLTPARLAAVKRFLQQRGIDGRQIYVESRISADATEPRLDVQIGGRQAND